MEQVTINPACVGRGSMDTRAAFTLTELVVVLGSVVLLAMVTFTANATIGHRAGTLECKSNLRQVGGAIELFANDHTNSLPGPAWAGAFFSYTSSSHDTIGYFIAPYLTLTTNGSSYEVEQLKCPASFQVMPNYAWVPPLQEPVCYLSTVMITNRPGLLMGTADNFYYPFGRPSSPYYGPTNFAAIKRPSEQWALVDADQRNTAQGSTYFSYLPLEPVHNNRPGGPRGAYLRNYLYFDGNVSPVKTAN